MKYLSHRLIGRSNKFISQKLDYIHANPCRGIWNLALTETEYIHSSAKFYETGEGICAVTNYTELEDIDLTKACSFEKAQSSRGG